MNMNNDLILEKIQPYRESLKNHPLYYGIQSVEDLKVFTQQHIFAVWDFMSLLKSLQRELTCVEIPWKPKGSAVVRRFINEIVWGEESDLDAQGKPASHFEMYYDAMSSLGASTQEIDALLSEMNQNGSLEEILPKLQISEQTKQFVDFTFQIIQGGKAHEIASVFTFGREDIIPDMFVALLRELNKNGNHQVSALLYYLERHIEVDGGEHGPIALKMMEELCGTEQQKWDEAAEVATKSLQNRILLWDGILEEITKKQLSPTLL
jgi:hypothetical protein